MKTTGLTVGDYVLVKPSMTLIKIAAVHQRKVGYYKVPNKLNWVRIDLLEPIFLTPEILEMNGFELCDDFFYHRVDDNPHYYDFKLKYGSDGYILEYNTYHLIIRYVHRLQRALRLHSLNDLANNFKVEE